MALPNQKLREIIFLLLFAKTNGMKDESDTFQIVQEQLKVSKPNVIKACEKVAEILSKMPKIDAQIEQVVVSYDFERIQTVEKTALRLGIYEILFDETIPPKVAIAESIRLTKKFGTPAATSFVNALLDAVYKIKVGEPIKKEEVKATLDELDKSYEI